MTWSVDVARGRVLATTVAGGELMRDGWIGVERELTKTEICF
jgi:hypothetical protein